MQAHAPRRLLIGSLAMGLACFGAGDPEEAALSPPPLVESAAGRPARVVMVSITGLSAEDARPDGPFPTIAGLARSGAAALRVEPVVPATLYPVHTTLVTGLSPAEHGVTADRLLGEHGVRRERFAHASYVLGDTLWQRAAERGPVGALDWPATVGAEIPVLLPDLVPDFPERRSELLQGATTGRILELAAEGGVDLGRDSARRDAFLVDMACLTLGAQRPPSLLLLRLTQARPALRRSGPRSPAVAQALSSADRELGRLLGCMASDGRLQESALAVVGGASWVAVHSVVRPNRLLAEAGLVEPSPAGVGSWKALVRATGATAFVYAEDVDAALLARERLEAFALRSAAFRLIPAEEMIALGADREAWFGLAATPGYAFLDDLVGPLVAPSAERGAPGALGADASPAFVLAGLGVRPGLVVPRMRQLDVAPTIAALLGITLPEASGVPVVGLLQSGASSLAGPAAPINPGKWRVEVSP